MLLYRITRKIFADDLKASGRKNRWNTDGKFIIYAASSLSLACLEVIVHTSGKALFNQNFSSVVISVPENIPITIIDTKMLHENWKEIEQSAVVQSIGDNWYKKKETLLLQVPSAIISKESNFLINTKHADFNKVFIAEVDSFMFDKRIKK